MSGEASIQPVKIYTGLVRVEAVKNFKICCSLIMDDLVLNQR